MGAFDNMIGDWSRSRLLKQMEAWFREGFFDSFFNRADELEATRKLRVKDRLELSDWAWDYIDDGLFTQQDDGTVRAPSYLYLSFADKNGAQQNGTIELIGAPDQNFIVLAATTNAGAYTMTVDGGSVSFPFEWLEGEVLKIVVADATCELIALQIADLDTGI